MELLIWVGLGWTLAAILVSLALGQLINKRNVQDAVEREAIRRRNALLDRGRTTERRPEHNGEASRVGKIRVVGERPGTADRPRRRL
jgi:hypothetical protein